ncbi:MAG: hypothetical protein ACXVEF_22430, partial [Polyangiales bacterium]
MSIALTKNECWPSLSVDSVLGVEHALQPPLSTLQKNAAVSSAVKEKVGVLSPVTGLLPDQPLMEVSGGPACDPPPPPPPPPPPSSQSAQLAASAWPGRARTAMASASRPRSRDRCRERRGVVDMR